MPRDASGKLNDVELEARTLSELERQLAALGAAGQVVLEQRRQLQVKGQRLIGFKVRVDGLSQDQSLAVQAAGLGGKRAMGCGIFVPKRAEA
jgi:CRISPR-associated protein Cas6